MISIRLIKIIYKFIYLFGADLRQNKAPSEMVGETTTSTIERSMHISEQRRPTYYFNIQSLATKSCD
jgi:predicted aconitase